MIHDDLPVDEYDVEKYKNQLTKIVRLMIAEQ
jgi:hypothetical protein